MPGLRMRSAMHYVAVAALAIVCAVFALAARAEGSVAGVTRYHFISGTAWSAAVGDLGLFDTAGEACEAYRAIVASQFTFGPVTIQTCPAGGGLIVLDRNGTGTNSGSLSPETVCPSSSSLFGGSCQCASGYAPGEGVFSGFCVPLTVCTAGQTYSAGTYDIGSDSTALPTAACALGCAYRYDGGGPVTVALVAGVKHYYMTGTYESTGAKCGAGYGDPTIAPAPPVAASAPPASTCPTGQALGFVNGRPTCAPVASPSASSPATGIADAPKDTTNTSTSVTTNPDGSTTKVTTTTTTFADGSKSSSTTTTTTQANGSSSSSTVTTNPNAGGNGSVGSGGAGTGGGGCSDNPSAAGCGGAATPIGTLREPGTRTVGDALRDAKTAFMASQFGSGVSGFFTVAGGGTCPTWVWDIPFLSTSVNVDVFCTSWALAVYLVMKVAVLIVAAFMAFRIAVE